MGGESEGTDEALLDGSVGPLTDVRVVDMADENGELCGRLLADLGADVIRVEPPEGARSRRLPPLTPDGSSSLYFTYRNANKRGVTLDITTSSGRDLLHRLLMNSDVWIESYSPGYLGSIELDPARLLERYPRLIITSISDFGQTGPYKSFVGSDMIGFAMGGMMYRAGVPERPPIVAPGSVAYDSTSITAALAVLIAILQRLRSGQGQHLDVSVMESVANMADWTLPSYSLSGGFLHRAGSGMVYPIYPCADGHVRLVVLSPREWRAMRSWLGEPDVIMDAVWEEFPFRIVNRDVLDPLILSLFSDKKKLELAHEAQSRGIAVTPVLTPAEVLANEHVVARDTFVSMEVAPGVEGKIPSGFFDVDGQKMGIRHRAPALGEHNAEVYSKKSSLPEDDLTTLKTEGVR